MITFTKTKILLLVCALLGSVFIVRFNNPVAAARYSINSGQSCSNRGEIRDFQAQRFICLKVNAKAGSSKGSLLVWVKISSPKSTTKSTSTTTTTATSLPRICREGSICEVGDRGPGGGWVFYVNPDSTSTGWKYLELAPTAALWNYDAPLPDSESYIPKFYTTFPDALLQAERYKTKTKDDWFLPTYEQLALAMENLWYLPDSPIAFRECLDAIRCAYLPFWTNSESSDKNSARVVRVGWTNSKFSEPKKINPKSLELTFRTIGSLAGVVAIRGEKIASTPTPTSKSASVTTTSTTSLTKTKLLSASYEVLDAARIKISWNFISSVREYRICVGDLCSGSNPQWLTIGPTENSKVFDLPLGQSQSYWVHALLLNDAKEYDSIDTRPCCVGTKWADGVTVSAKNNFSP